MQKDMFGNKKIQDFIGTIYYLLPEEKWNQFIEAQNRIIAYLENNPNEKRATGEYISEASAKEEFGRGTTWFYEMRKSGKLASVKVGNKVYYKKADLLSLFTNED